MTMAEQIQRKPASDLFEPVLDEQIQTQAMRIAEAVLFASPEPLSEDSLAAKFPKGTDIAAVMQSLSDDYAQRGVTLRRIAGKWMFRTADDLADHLRHEKIERRNLTRAQLETLAIIVYHQPVTRAEIEDIRGVTTSKGTLDILLTTGWIRMRGRRKAPGRPVTYGTTEDFLVHFGLDGIKDLPGLDELRGAGLLDTRLPSGFSIPSPNDDDDLQDDEDPLEDDGMTEELEAADIDHDESANENQPETAVIANDDDDDEDEDEDVDLQDEDEDDDDFEDEDDLDDDDDEDDDDEDDDDTKKDV